MGTICSTSRSIRVREHNGNPGDTRCDPTPPRNQHYQGATNYTHRYTSLHTKREDPSLMVANPYALEGTQTELKQSEEQYHYFVTVDEATKILPTQETGEQLEPIANAVSNTSPNGPQLDQPETTESIDNGIENIANEQQPVQPELTEEQPESLKNTVLNTSPNEPHLKTTESIDNRTGNITNEQQPVQPGITELEPRTLPNSTPIQPECTVEQTYTQENQFVEDLTQLPSGLTDTPNKTEEYSGDSTVPLSPRTDISIASTDAFDNTLDITTQANSTVLCNETIEYPQKANSPYTHNIQDDTTQGLESDLTNVTRELDEAATDIVESVLNKTLETPNLITNTEGNLITNTEGSLIDERDGGNNI